MSKTTFIDGDSSQSILGTIVTAAFLNMLNNQRHTGRDIDGEGALDYAVATGSANAYAITLTPALDAYIPGMPIVFKANHENTGAATLNVDALGALSLKKYGARALGAGDIKNGQIVVGIYDGTNIQIISDTSAVPVSAELLWPTETPPEGWLEEDGSSLVRATYPALFAAIGTMYGAADSTHFNLPDARGRFPRAWAHGQTTDPDRASRTAPTATGATISAGDHVGTNQADAFQGHYTEVGGSGAVGNTAGTDRVVRVLPNIALDQSISTGFGGQNPITDGTHGTPRTSSETRSINTNRMMIIKAY